MNKYRLAQSYSSSSQTISSVVCANSFASNIMLIPGSNKTLEIYDVCKNSALRTIKNPHKRPVHSCWFNEVSKYVALHESDHNLFLSSACDDCVKIWDLRCDGLYLYISSFGNSSANTYIIYDFTTYMYGYPYILGASERFRPIQIRIRKLVQHLAHA